MSVYLIIYICRFTVVSCGYYACLLFLKTNFIYLLRAVLDLHHYVGFSLSLLCAGFSSWWLLLFQSRLQGMWASAVVAPGLWSTHSIVVVHRLTLRHVGSSWIRDRTCVSCTVRQILYHWATREDLFTLFYLSIGWQNCFAFQFSGNSHHICLPSL